jgi:hypothetical protein
VILSVCVLLRSVTYILEGNFVDSVNFYLPCIGFAIDRACAGFVIIL